VLVAANLGLVDDPLPGRLAARTGRAVVMEKDGNAAALAESRFGAAYGSRVSMTLTVGTGVGGGVVIRNELLTGGRGLAGELGHLSIDPDGPQCACGGVGCLEAYACGPAIVRAATAAGLTARTPRDVVAAAGAGDAAATAAIRAAAVALGHGIARMCAVVDPEVVVVGGGVTAGAGELFLDPVRWAVATHLPLRAVVMPPRVEAATTGPAAGAIGAAALAWDVLDEGSLG
jgi:glucokinase